ncbi:MAG: ribosome-associated translation inhibitor RaiA [Deltaproteobacteria bacterium]|nr:ribosome-associated translation inhibitor RaiA [Deltaproteobacteria bacterium]
MQVAFTFRQFDGNEDLKALIESRVSRRLDHLVSGEAAEARVTISTEKAWTTLEIHVAAWGEVIKAAEKTATDLNPTIDLVIDKLERQLLRRKEIAKDRRLRARTEA